MVGDDERAGETDRTRVRDSSHTPQETPSLPSPETVMYCCAIQRPATKAAPPNSEAPDTTHERRRATTKRCCVPTRAQSRRRRSMGHAETWCSPRQRGPVARAGGLLLPPMRAWLEQPHGRRHKAPPQPCALTTTTRQLPCGHAAVSLATRAHRVRRCLARCSALRPEPRRLGRLALEIGLEDPAQVGDLRGFVGVLGSVRAARGGVDLIKSASAELPNAVCAPTDT